MGTLLEDAVSRVKSVFTTDFVRTVVEDAPSEPEALRAWMIRNVPDYATFRKQHVPALRRSNESNSAQTTLLPAESIWLTTDGAIFDIIAKRYLNTQKDACTSIFHIDLAVTYGDVSVCYRLHLKNPNGGIDGKRIFMGCDVDLAGWGTASACVRNPCGNDPCTSYSLGLGIRGPLKGGLELDTRAKESDGERIRILKVNGFIGDFPGLYIIGLPGMLDEIANKILNAATSFLFAALLNDLLKQLSIYIVSIPIRVPGTHVQMEIRDFSVEAAGGNLTLGIKPRFSTSPKTAKKLRR